MHAVYRMSLIVIILSLASCTTNPKNLPVQYYTLPYHTPADIKLTASKAHLSFLKIDLPQ